VRIFVSSLRKLARRPASFVTVGLLFGLFCLIVLGATATVINRAGTQQAQGAERLLLFPAAYDFVLSFLFGLGGLFGVIYGAAIAGSEWGWGTLKNAVARGESRWRYMLMTFAAIALVIAIGLAITFALGVLAALVGANVAGVSTSGLNSPDTFQRLPEEFARGWFAVTEEASLGFAIATLARSQLAGIGAGIAFYFGETFASIFLPDIIKYLPFDVARASIAIPGSAAEGGGTVPGFEPLSADFALFLVGVWLVGSLLVALVYSDRAEITG
jgi:ABC-type transport system involved in multi-copper enzyme maturation permease subunit